MEELGIGRPSTYSSIISVLQDRGYVKLEKKRFIPEERGKLVVVFLKEFFAKYVEYNYTAGLEDELDIISNGELSWKKFLKDFWVDFDKNINQVAEKSITEILQSINERLAVNIFGVDENNNIKNKCPSCADGILGLKIGKYGVFIGCSNYPDCKHTMQVAHDKSEDSENPLDKSFDEPKSLGKIVGEGEVFIKKGPYGFYIELLKDEASIKPEKKSTEKKGKKTAKSKVPKPKRVSIPKNIKIEEVDLKLAKKLLSLPREVGNHPETGLKIVASIGPFGPYLLHDGKYASVKEDDILEIGLNRAVVLISENEARKLAKNAKDGKSKKVVKTKVTGKAVKK
jgi:DNA topoisomerase-1